MVKQPIKTWIYKGSIFKLTILLMIFILGPAFVVYAQTTSQAVDYQTSQEIAEISEQIEGVNSRIDELIDRAEEYAKAIEEKQAETESLENELAIINNRLAKLELDIEKKDAEIEKANLEIKEINLEVSEAEQTIDFQQTQLAALLRKIYRQDRRGTLEILFAHKTLSDFFSYIKQLDDMQAKMQVTVAAVKETKRDLEIHEHDLESEKAELQNLLLEIEIERQKFEEEKGSKQNLINETEMDEEEFQNLLSEIRSQQRQANEAIASLEQDIQQKLLQAQLNNPDFILNPGQILWPIPNQGITVYFHDPTYPFAHIVGPHSGLDIRTLVNGDPTMGLSLRAPASGVVIKTIHEGRFTGNAIFLSHGDIMTVFYHLSAVYVQKDQFVSAGEVMGLTGGAAGAPGAGLSSGPHLHFEVRQNGIPVDPCQFLSPGC